MSSRLRARGGSPLVKTVFQVKRNLTPVVGPDDTSDWSNSSQSTLDDWFEGDVDTDGNDPEEECDTMESPEKLREAVHHHPVHLHPDLLQTVGGNLKLQLARSPAVESLGDLLDIKPRKYKLLNSPHHDSTSSLENFTLTLSSKKSSVMSSTVVVGDEKKPEMIVDDISAIKTRKSLDPRLSVQPFKKEGVAQGLIRKLGGHGSLGVSATNKMPRRQSRLLSSTPARSYQINFPVIPPDSSVVSSRLPTYSRVGRKRLSSDLSEGRSILSSLDTSGEIFSLVVHKNQVRMTVPCPPIGRDRVGGSRGKKRFRLATRQPQPAMSLFSKAEYYRGKQSSEMKFDMLEEEEEENNKARVFSQ